jgi:putative acetyltransferase
MDAKDFELESVIYRRSTHADYESLGHVMFEAVRSGPSQYTEQQREAWVPQPRTGIEWTSRLDSQYVIVADLRGTPIGFMSLAESGYIDFAYIQPEFRGRGIFRRLYEHVEAKMVRQDRNRLWVHASLNAKDAFLALGFAIVKRETVAIKNIELERFEMEKLFGSIGT